jgi:hypothetical protein
VVPALLAALGGGLLTAILNVAGLRVGATPAELVLWSAIGVLFARAFRIGGLVVGVPLLLAGIELAAGGGGGTGAAAAGDPLTLAFPGGRSLASDQLVFAVAYVSWAAAFGLRWRVVASLAAGVLLLSLLRESPLPALTLLGAALLLPNLDRLRGVLREG